MKRVATSSHNELKSKSRAFSDCKWEHVPLQTIVSCAGAQSNFCVLLFALTNLDSTSSGRSDVPTEDSGNKCHTGPSSVRQWNISESCFSPTIRESILTLNSEMRGRLLLSLTFFIQRVTFRQGLWLDRLHFPPKATTSMVGCDSSLSLKRLK